MHVGGEEAEETAVFVISRCEFHKHRLDTDHSSGIIQSNKEDVVPALCLFTISVLT